MTQTAQKQIPKIWEGALALLEKRLPEHTFRMWIDPLCASIKNGTLMLSCPNEFSKKRVRDNYLGQIEDALRKSRNGNDPMKIELKVSEEAEDSKKQRSSSASKQPQQLSFPAIANHTAALNLRQNFTLKNFVVGSFNRYAHDATLNIVESARVFQPVFILSGPGLGKSHLEQAAAQHAFSLDTSTRILYITASDFTDEVVTACKNGSIETFKEKFRNGCDVLIIDDVHFLGGKNRTQLEMHLIIDHLLNDGKKLIFSSMYLPAEIPKVDVQLASRLTASTISEISRPNFSSRTKILEATAATNGCEVPGGVIEFLASTLTGDICQLKSGLLGLLARQSILKTPLDIANAKLVAADLVKKQKAITPSLIKKIVCKYYRLTPKELVSKSRRKSIVRPRQIAIYFCRQYTDLPLQTIGKEFNRYHATALHAIGIIEKALKVGGPLAGQVEYIEKQLEAA